ncbi:MAG TPA: NAD(P)-dependent oxidoreductase [Caldimonas sp.]|jgi:3-hydroxyisobutyrate dehydrogenase-like beta-hydroxyacid dehydrogenase|nr:NAD(P)-dependent oxidoreductase [Caldimonas sp.]HEX2543026.1 NAD(P)-dependent oxidoreductase [Caldimonas sp.]
MHSAKASLGFIGLGVMGRPMVSHLAAAGHPVTLHDRVAGLAEDIARTLAGARVAPSPAALAAQSDMVITMVPNGAVVRDLIVGPGGLLEGLQPGSLLLDTSSSEPWLTEESGRLLAGAGVAMVDAPVSGAQWGAEAAELVFMCGGTKPDLQRVRPLLDVMGKAVFHLGPLGAGHAMKCLNNTITAMNLLAATEGLAIGKRYGLDPAAMVDVLDHSTGMSWVSQTHLRQRVISRTFDDPFKLALMVKDIGIAMQLARSENVPAPLSAVGQELWRAAAIDAAPDASVSELARWVERMAKTEITAGSGET